VRSIRYLIPALVLLMLVGASTASAAGAASAGAASGAPGSQPGNAGTGGAGVDGTAAPGTPTTPSHPTVPGFVAKVKDGLAYAPANAPIQVQKAIWAGDQIRRKPYVYGGGHGVWKDFGYDCSGSVSYVLHAAGLLKTSMDSSEFESWGQRGAGQWITVYTNPGHAFIQIAGIRFDTSAEDDPNPPPGSGPRWRPLMTSTAGFQARHPAGL
jgi:cell wall-associated NlpC family hydrolase